MVQSFRNWHNVRGGDAPGPREFVHGQQIKPAAAN
jgi:hypothetical protein